jgi:hypothetical protein
MFATAVQRLSEPVRPTEDTRYAMSDNVVRYEKYTRNGSRNFQIRPDRCYIRWVAISGQQ